MNLGEARAAVEQRGFDYLNPARTDLMLNTAKDTFEDMWRWPWLDALITGATPLIIADLKLIQTVSVSATGDELLGITVQQLAQNYRNVQQAGTPEYWWIEGDDTLHVWPGDGVSVSVVYTRESPALVTDADTPLIPVRYQSLWVDLAVCEAYKDSDNFPAAQALRGDVAARMNDVIMRYETRNRQHSPFMTVRTFSEDD